MKKITEAVWYQEAQRSSGLTRRQFATNAIVSLLLLAGLALLCAFSGT